MEFKATKDIRLDSKFIEAIQDLYRYMGCLKMSGDPLVQHLTQLVIDCENRQWNVIFEHLLELDREIQRLNKELIFKDTP